MKKIDRRLFLKRSGTVAAGAIIIPTIIPACARGRDGHKAPSDRINMAFIGAGNMGCNDVKNFLADNRVQITASCDVNRQSEYQDERLGGRDYFICVADNPWEHHFEADNYCLLENADMKSCLEKDFLKISYKTDLEKVTSVQELGERCISDFASLLRSR